ncbi:MAG: asparagine synthase (glutamine-hydrolyzing) [Frankiaceae bacterium]
MCGIAGFWGAPDRALLAAMAEVQCHRGPDDDGFLESEEASLAFRRLSIIDIAHGAQPMGTEDGSVQVVFNGEIYNYRDLRGELRTLGHTFRTDCDTEAIVHAYEEWGTDAFHRFNGMWGIGILDRRGAAPKLVLCRDHFGIKPVYWARSGDRLLFASEIKALLQDPSMHVCPNDQRILDYLVTGIHDHTSETFFAGVHQLQPGHWMSIHGAGDVRDEGYWEPVLTTDGDGRPEKFRELFLRSIERRLIADVPVGTCLSGGIDSSSIVMAMTQLLRDHAPDARSMGDRLKTFSALFDGDPIDESEYINVVLAASGAESYEVRPTSERFFTEVEDFIWHVEEPTVSTGPYAQWCVQREAREQVTVLLDGQGGDELLAGYVPYQFFYLRQLLKERKFGVFAREAWGARDTVGPLVRRKLENRRHALPIRSLLNAEWVGRLDPPQDPRSTDNLKLRLLQDLLQYSLPSALRYEDRNSMAHSLEARLPYLDQELVEWVLSLPPDVIIRDGWSRWINREGLRDMLPEKIRNRRKKIGFTTPEARWLKARRVILQSIYRSPAFVSRPYWDGLKIAEMWRRACAGEIEPHLFFWRVVALEIWLRVFFDEGRLRSRKHTVQSSFQAIGDEAYLAQQPAETRAAVGALAANEGRHLVLVAGAPARPWLRAPLRSRLISSGDDLTAALREALATSGAGLRPGDLLATSEKVVAISQGRSLPLAEIHPTRLARTLSRFVSRTPVGIGLGVPETMQLALDEVGPARIVRAAVAAAVTRPFGAHGVFYRIVGTQVSAIDGPTPHTIPPYNTHAKRAPEDPAGVAAALSRALSADAGGPVEVAVIDVNDIGANILGASPGVDERLLADLLADNPLGQGGESTPFLLVRSLDVGGSEPTRSAAA